MTNLTDITHQQLQALKDFATTENKELVSHLEEILDDVAKTGQYIFPWHFMKPLYAHKLDKVTEDFLTTKPPLKVDGTEDNDEVENLKEFRIELLEMFDKFVSAPFTIQRVTELLTNPKQHYKTTAKFFRGLEKNIMVVSTVDHVPAEQRQILKRSHMDSIPQSNQNGYVENEQKPPEKKSFLENWPRKQVEQQSSESLQALDTMNSTKQTEDANVVGSADNTNVNEQNENTKLENMLLCTEQVNDTLADKPVKTDTSTVKNEENKETEEKCAKQEEISKDVALNMELSKNENELKLTATEPTKTEKENNKQEDLKEEKAEEKNMKDEANDSMEQD